MGIEILIEEAYNMLLGALLIVCFIGQFWKLTLGIIAIVLCWKGMIYLRKKGY